MENKSHPESNPPPRAPYETTDANLAAIILFGVALLIVCVLSYLGVGKMFRAFENRAQKADRIAAQSQAAPSVARIQPYFPLPREQASPREEFTAFKARALDELNSYGWIDRRAGVVRLPIDRAMELLLQRGLPTRTNANEPGIGPSDLQLQQERVRSQTSSNPKE